MTFAQLALDHRLLPTLPQPRGFSDEARFAERLVERGTEGPIRMGQLECIHALSKALVECSVEDWDGYGATPMDLGTYVNVLEFLEAMPSHWPVPELSVEPDGDVSLEWIVEQERMLSISLGSTNRLSYAAMFGENTAYGTEYFTDEIPAAVIQNLARLFPSCI